MKRVTSSAVGGRVPPLIIAASILAANFGNLAAEVRAVDNAGADSIHVDVMDGRFVPDITIGPRAVAAMRRATAKPLNVHLMIVEPDRQIDAFATAGADHILVHAEATATVHLHRVLGEIRALGCKAGVVLDPGSPVAVIEYVLQRCDIIMVMTVNPGAGGQSFLREMLPKIRHLRALCSAYGVDPIIEVDGGLDGETIGLAVEAGANAIAVGSAIFESPDYATAIRSLRRSPGGAPAAMPLVLAES